MSVAKITLGAVDNTRAAFESAKSNLQGLHTQATAVLGALGALGSVSMFASMIKGSIDAAAGLNDLSIQTGATVEALSALGEIGRLSDVSTEMIGSAMNKLAKNMAGATEESKGTGKALEALGINFNDFKKLSADEQMMAVAKAMDQSADGSGKAAVAMAIYSKEGARMLPFLKDLANAGDLQAIVTAEQAAQSDNFADNLTKLQVSGSAWKNELAMGMIPALDIAAQAFLDVTNGADGLRDGTRQLAADGSIKEWTKAGITGLTYLADAAQYVIRVVKATGESIGAYAAAGVAYFGGIGMALKQVMTGDFSGAVASMKSGMDASKTIITGLGDSLITTFGEDTVGAKIRARMKDIEAIGATAEKAKPKLDFTNVLDKNAKADKEAAKAAKELEKAYTELVKTAQTLANARNAEAEGIDAWFQAEEKARLATVKAANDSVQAAQDEYDNFGKTKSQIAEVTLARLNDKLQGVNAGTEIAASIQLEIDAQNRLIGILQKGEVRDASVEAAKDAASEWKKTTDDIGRGLTDSLFRAFEAGKGFFSTLWSGIRNLFKTTALKLIINPVAGAVTSGLSSAANAVTGGSGGSGLLSNLSSANSLYSLASTGYAATLGAGVSSVLGATAGNAAIATAITGSASSATAAALAASQAAGTATAASATLASVGSSIAAAVPYLAAALAAAAIVNSLLSKKDSRFGGTYADNFSGSGAQYIHGPVQGSTGDQAVRDAINATAAGINGMLKAVGSSASLVGYQAALETSNKGRGGVLAGGTLSTGATFGEDAVGSNYDGTYYETTSTNSPDSATANANFALDLKQSIIQALQASTDIPDVIKGMVAGIDIELHDAAAVDRLLGEINAVVLGVTGFQEAVKTLPFAYLRDMSFDTAAAFIAAAGGMEALSGKLGGYYENFYSEEEKKLTAQKNIATALNSVGFDFDAGEIAAMTREQYRQIYEAHVEAFGADNPLSMMLLNVSASFAAITPVSEAAVVAVDGVVTSVAGLSDAMKRLMDETASLQVDLMRAQGNTAGANAALYALDTAGLSEAERGVFDYNASLRLQITALTDASAAAAQLAADTKAAADALASTNQGWKNQIDLLSGAETDRSIALRDAGDDSTRALMNQVYAQQDLRAATDAAAQAAANAAAALASTNQGWKNQLDLLSGAETERSIALRDAGDDSTRALMNQVYAQQDLQAATATAAAATQTAAAALAQVEAAFLSAGLAGAAQMADAQKAQRADLQRQLDALTLSGPALADKQFEALSRVNAVLFKQVQATTAVADAQKDLSDVAQDAVSSFGALGDSLRDFRAGVLASAAGVNGSQAATALAAGNFRSVSSRAGLGDKGAMGQLAGVGQDYLSAAAKSASTALDYQKALMTVLGGTDSAISVADRQVSLAERQLGALNGIKEVLTMAQAQSALASAQGSLDRVNANAPFDLAMAKASDAYSSALNNLALQGFGSWQKAYDDPEYAKTLAIETAAKEAALKATYEAAVVSIKVARSQAVSAPVPASYRAPVAAAGASNADVVAELKRLGEQLAVANREIALNTQRSARLADKWDIDGQPAVRQPVVKAA